MAADSASLFVSAGCGSSTEGHAASRPGRSHGRTRVWGGAPGVILCSQHVRCTLPFPVWHAAYNMAQTHSLSCKHARSHSTPHTQQSRHTVLNYSSIGAILLECTNGLGTSNANSSFVDRPRQHQKSRHASDATASQYTDESLLLGNVLHIERARQKLSLSFSASAYREWTQLHSICLCQV